MRADKSNSLSIAGERHTDRSDKISRRQAGRQLARGLLGGKGHGDRPRSSARSSPSALVRDRSPSLLARKRPHHHQSAAQSGR